MLERFLRVRGVGLTYPYVTRGTAHCVYCFKHYFHVDRGQLTKTRRKGSSKQHQIEGRASLPYRFAQMTPGRSSETPLHGHVTRASSLPTPSHREIPENTSQASVMNWRGLQSLVDSSVPSACMSSRTQMLLPSSAHTNLARSR